jgi:hypothetical protein
MPENIGALTGLIVIASCAAVLGMSYVAAYLLGKNAARKELDRRNPLGAPAEADRLNRIESAVDSIALEVERLGEGQRFLLGSRPEKPAQPVKQDRRHATPV